MAKLITEKDVIEDYFVKKDVPEEINTGKGNIELVNVKFKYPNKPDVPVLKNVSIKVENN